MEVGCGGTAGRADLADVLSGGEVLTNVDADAGIEVTTSCGELTGPRGTRRGTYPGDHLLRGADGTAELPAVVTREVGLLVDLPYPDPERLAEADAQLRRRIHGIKRKAEGRIEERASHAWQARRDARETRFKLSAQPRAYNHAVHPLSRGILHSGREFTSGEDKIALTATLERVAGGELPDRQGRRDTKYGMR